MKIWRFTGNPENWLTALERKAWALNENNLNNWQKLQKGDVIIFHSTAKSDFHKDAKSAVIGFGYVGGGLYEKEELWWIQEIRDKKNYWSYVVPLSEVYTYSDLSEIDFSKPIQQKSKEQIISEIEVLLDNSISIRDLEEKAKKEDNKIPNFPVNGSASGINPFYEEIILKDYQDFFVNNNLDNGETVLEKRIAETTDYYYENISIDDAKNKLILRDSGDSQYTYSTKARKNRKEDARQKRLIARIEGYSCQICGFKYQYTNQSGKKACIYEVDHIQEKSSGGNENPDNLWVLCPNCHAKKTKGIITIDKERQIVKEDGVEIKLHHDSHLFSQE